MDDAGAQPDDYLASPKTSMVSPSLDSLTGAYRPLLDRIERECFQLLRAALSEAESLRMAARDEYHRIISTAHQERSRMLKDAADGRAAMYAELDLEIAARVEETERQKASMLAAAEAAAVELRKAAIDDARAQVRNELGVTDVHAIGASPATAAPDATTAPSALAPSATVASATAPSASAPSAAAADFTTPPTTTLETAPAGVGEPEAQSPLAPRGGGDDPSVPTELDHQIFARVPEDSTPDPAGRTAPPDAPSSTTNGVEPKEHDRRNPFRRKG